MSVNGLRPMTMGDILDQSFSIYRRNFSTLVGIVAVVHVPLLILQVSGGLLFGTTLANGSRATAFTPNQSAALLAGIGLFVLSALLGGMAAVFEGSALAVVVSERLMGNSASLRQAYGRALSHWRGLSAMICIIIGVTLVLTLVLFIPLVVLAVVTGALLGTGAGTAGEALLTAPAACMFCAGLPVIAIATYAVSVRFLFAPQAIVLEDKGGIEGLRRSWKLVGGSFWRVVGITLVLTILIAIIGQGPTYVIAFLASVLPSPALAIIVNAVAQSIITVIVLPLQFAAITLLYYDLRIRKEGFDLQLLAKQLVPTLGGLAADSPAKFSAV